MYVYDCYPRPTWTASSPRWTASSPRWTAYSPFAHPLPNQTHVPACSCPRARARRGRRAHTCRDGPPRCTARSRTTPPAAWATSEVVADKRVYCHEALHLKQKLQSAGYKQAVEKWDTDSDSDESDDEADLAM